jgi:hypothetical protein
MKIISLWDLNRPLRFMMKGFDKITGSDQWKAFLKNKEPTKEDTDLYVYMDVYNGGSVIAKPKTTKAVQFSNYPRFFQYIEFEDILLRNLPREARICKN